METGHIRGVLPVVHTPFTTDDAIDYPALRREVDFAFDSYADGIVMALASEILRLTHRERLEMTARLVEYAAGRGPVIIGVHAESTAQALEYATAAREAGASAVMATPPLQSGWEPETLFAHFERLLKEGGLPVVVQDGSAYVGRPMSVEFQAGLREKLGPGILYKPEGHPVGPLMSRLIAATGGEGVVFEGMAGMYLVDSFRRGVKGSMPGCDLVDAVAALWQALERGDEERVYKIHPLLCALTALQVPTLDLLLSLEKHILVRRGIFTTAHLRAPNSYRLDDHTRDEADRIFDRLMAVLGEA